MTNYSPKNKIVKVNQDAKMFEQVTEYQTWKFPERQVTKGKQGIRIIAPVRIRSPTAQNSASRGHGKAKRIDVRTLCNPTNSLSHHPNYHNISKPKDI